MVKKKKGDPLTGEELLSKVKELGDLSKDEKARICGYSSLSEKGVERVNLMQFSKALIEATGLDLDETSNGTGRGGRSASYRIKVQSNGNLLIGAAYTKQMELQPGDEFEITLGRKYIQLKPVEASA
jgi:hypothetical protein